MISFIHNSVSFQTTTLSDIDVGDMLDEFLDQTVVISFVAFS